MPNCGGNDEALSVSPPSASCSVPVNVHFFRNLVAALPLPLNLTTCRPLAPGWKVDSVRYSGTSFTIEHEAWRTQPDLLCLTAVIDPAGPWFPFNSLFWETGTVTIAGVTLVGPLDAAGPEEAFQ